MPWFRVDDDLARHPKILSISRRDRAAAMGLWCLAGAWSAANLTDGVIPEYLPQELGCSKRLADVLVEAGLWVREARAWRFHAWAERQPSRDQVEAKRLAERERQARWRAEQEQKRRSKAEQAQMSRRDSRSDADVTNDGETRSLPDPALPDPTRLPTEDIDPTDYVSGEAPKRRRATRLPDGFPVTSDMQAWAAQEAPNAGTRDHDAFCDYWQAKSGKDATKVDWVATWRNWMRKASDERGGRPGGARGSQGPGPAPKSGPDQRAADVARLAADLQARRDGIPHLRAIGE